MRTENECKRALGIDIGSTTAKVVFSRNGKIEYERYERHLSEALEKTLEMLTTIKDLLSEAPFTVAISGSAGLGVAQASGLPFVQEVYATGEFIKQDIPDAGAVIELGGEDAKVIFIKGGTDARMNGTCAGGTGAFIDQMASLLDMSIAEMDAASLRANRIYPIASRCGVFAKTDVQALFNQGATKEDVAASIYQAVVNQTITGLAQGRSLDGKIIFLGGPLYYCEGLRRRFRETLDLTEETGVCPEYARFSVARGAAMQSVINPPITYDEMVDKLIAGSKNKNIERGHVGALFENEEEYKEFYHRHAQATVEHRSIEDYEGPAWLGIDSGSTTTKLVLLSEDKKILYDYYTVNKGSPLKIVHDQLIKIRQLCGDRIQICGSATTGYGEALIKNAFHADMGVVETIAHFTAAQHFEPQVDFILDIGGQDIKCFYIKNSAIDSIMLNEACSSGCGSFLETFAHSMGYKVEDFAKLGIKSRSPVDLGSRCTVFMNSSIKQAQKDGAKIEDISAGLSISVVKNALYKVIRAASPEDLGEHIVVQGGTLLNDAVLRAFEKELGREVVRPEIAGLMGAFGAALCAMEYQESDLLSAEELANFSHKSKTSICKGCSNNCNLTINIFADGGRFISGNQCQRPLGNKEAEKLPNIYQWKQEFFKSLQGKPGPRGKIGLPMALAMYEQAPLWLTIFTKLGYEVVFTDLSTRATYEKGQFSVPSDTVCYPAKIMHGHIEELLEQGIDLIFYPSLTYNVDEHKSDNHFNCPIVAYYGETINGNIDSLEDANFFFPYLNINSRRALTRTLHRCLSKQVDATISKFEVAKAVWAGFRAMNKYWRKLRKAGEDALAFAKENDKRVVILAGRPYHVDPEINHGIDRLASSLGFVVVSEDSVCHLAPRTATRVLNQWTYHSRLYHAAKFATTQDNVELVQLISFGCGVDAITSDEVRSILEDNDKLYTQIKIDDINNLGAVRIRLRSLIGALEAKDNHGKN